MSRRIEFGELVSGEILPRRMRLLVLRAVNSVVEHLSKENGTSAKLHTNPHSKSLQFPEKNAKRGLTAGRFKVRYWTKICYYIAFPKASKGEG